MYGNARGEPALRVTVFSYRGRVVYSFSEGFRVQDIATILHVGCTFLKMLIKLYRETSTVNYPQGWYGMFVACGIWCLADVSSVSPSSEQYSTLRQIC